MGSAIDLFVTYRFIKLLVTPFEKTDAYKLGIIDKDGNRIIKDGTRNQPEVELDTSQLKNAYTVLHKLVFNIKKIFQKVPGLRTKLGTYAAATFLLKDTFKEEVDPNMFERELLKYLEEQGVEFDNSISEEVIGFGEVLPKGEYVLVNDILNKDEDSDDVKKGDRVVVYSDETPVDTVLGVDIFPVIHEKSKEKIFVALTDLKNA